MSTFPIIIDSSCYVMSFPGREKSQVIGPLVHWHDLRHSFAATVTGRVHLHDIAELIGHKDMRMTRRYAHLNLESLRNAVKTLDVTALPQIEQSASEDNGDLIDISILNEQSEE